MEDSQKIYEEGNKYYFGKDVERDYEKAKRYYEQAVKKGHVGALETLGDMYMYGDEVQRDYGKARKYYEQAGERVKH